MSVSLKLKTLPKLEHFSNGIDPSAGILTKEGSPELPAAVITKHHTQGGFGRQQKCIPSQFQRLVTESPVWAEPQPSQLLGKDSSISSSSQWLQASGSIIPDLCLCPHVASFLGARPPMSSPLTASPSLVRTRMIETGLTLLQNGLFSINYICTDPNFP